MWPLPLSVAEQQIGSMRSPRPHCFCECEAAFPTPCFQHGRTHTKQIRGRSLKSKPREIQTESRQPYSFRFPNIAKLLFKRVKYISIRRGKTLPQRCNNDAILVWISDTAAPVVTIFIGGVWLAVGFSGCFGTGFSRGALEKELSEPINVCYLKTLQVTNMFSL